MWKNTYIDTGKSVENCDITISFSAAVWTVVTEYLKWNAWNTKRTAALKTRLKERLPTILVCVFLELYFLLFDFIGMLCHWALWASLATRFDIPHLKRESPTFSSVFLAVPHWCAAAGAVVVFCCFMSNHLVSY